MDQAVDETEEVLKPDDPVWKQPEELMVAKIEIQDLLEQHSQLRPTGDW